MDLLRSWLHKDSDARQAVRAAAQEPGGGVIKEAPMKIDGRAVELIGMIWHFGFGCAESGDSCNTLTPHIGDANTMIPEYKVFLVDIRKA